MSTNCLDIKELIVYMVNEADILLLDDAHCRGHCVERQAASLLVLAVIVQFPLSSRLLGSLMLGLCLGFGWFFSLHSCSINRLLLLCRVAADVLRFSFDPSLDAFLNRYSVQLKAKQTYCTS